MVDAVGRIGQIKQKIGINPANESSVGDYMAGAGISALTLGGIFWYLKGSQLGKLFALGGLASTVVSLFFAKQQSGTGHIDPVVMPLSPDTILEKDPKEYAKECLRMLKDRTRDESTRTTAMLELARVYKKDGFPVISILTGCLQGKGEVLRENPDAPDVALAADGDSVKTVTVDHDDENISLGLRGGAALALAETGNIYALRDLFEMLVATRKEHDSLHGPLSEQQIAFASTLEKAFTRSLEVLTEGNNADNILSIGDYFDEYLKTPNSICDATAYILLKNGICSKYLSANNAANVSFYYASHRSDPGLQTNAISSLTEAINTIALDDSPEGLISLYGLYADITNSFSSLDLPLESHEAALLKTVETKVQENTDKIIERNDPDEISQLNDAFDDLYPNIETINDVTAEAILQSGVHVFFRPYEETELALRFIDNSGNAELQNTSINILNDAAAAEVEHCGHQSIPFLHNITVMVSEKFSSMDIPTTDEQNNLLTSLNSMLSDELTTVREKDDYGERDFLEASFNEKCDDTASVSDLSAGVLFTHGIVPEFVSPGRSLRLSLRYAKDDEKPVLQKGSVNALVRLSENYSGGNEQALVYGLYDTLVHVRTHIAEGRSTPDRQEQARLLDESIQNVLTTIRRSGNNPLKDELIRFFKGETAGGD